MKFQINVKTGKYVTIKLKTSYKAKKRKTHNN